MNKLPYRERLSELECQPHSKQNEYEKELLRQIIEWPPDMASLAEKHLVAWRKANAH